MARGRGSPSALVIVVAVAVALPVGALAATARAARTGSLSVGVTVVAACGTSGKGPCSGAAERAGMSTEAASRPIGPAPVRVRRSVDPDSGATILTVVY